MAFKLGKERRGIKSSSNVKLVNTPLDKGTIAEARNDGTIAISPDVDQTNKKNMNRIIKHEMKHMRDMQEGRAAYGDNWMMWDGKIYIRMTVILMDQTVSGLKDIQTIHGNKRQCKPKMNK